MSKGILITGASSGFGKLTLDTLSEKGHKVVASMRNTGGKNKEKAEALRAAGVHVVDIDVTDEESVNAGVAEAIKLVGDLDVVVNNAGVGVIGMQEHFTPDDFKRLFDVNVIGVQRVNRAVLPHMRERGSGLLIHISSLLGRMSLPFYGPYNASKWALEALAENYRVELSAFGIDSCLVEPGGFATNFFEGLMRPSDQSRNESYGEFMNAPVQMFESFEGALASNEVQKPQLVADAVAQLVDTPAGERPLRTVVDKMGMGDPIVAYNEQADQFTEAIYSNFGIAGMRKVKVS